jgi:hypothetical protein
MNIVENHLTLQKNIPVSFLVLLYVLNIQPAIQHMVRLQASGSWPGSILMAKANNF